VMNRTTKQLIYGAVYLVIALLVILGVYGIWFRKMPTCFDNIQNQGETGVDCGGPCVPCALKNLSIDTSVKPMPLQAGTDQSVILLTFKDDSGDYGADFSYNVVVDSVILGEQIDAFNGTSSIAPDGSRYIVLTGIPDNAADIGSINLTTSNVSWVPSAKVVQYDLSISGTSTDITQSGGYVGGTISNNTASNITDLKLSAILYDNSGNIIGASDRDVGSVPAFSKEPFQVFFPSMDIRTLNSVDKTKTQILYEVTQN